MAGFKDFILRGNVVDLAVGIIIGVAFGGVVDSLTKDVISPIIGSIVGQPDFSAVKAGPILIGNFINAVIGFIIRAAVIYFFIVKPFQALMTKMYPPPAPGDPPPSPEVVLLTDIRDTLKRNSPAAETR